MEFEWDPEKDAANRDKHGIGFEAVHRLWADPNLVVADALYPREERWLATGVIAGKYWTAVFTERGTIVRIISLRRARKREIAEHGAGQS